MRGRGRGGRAVWASFTVLVLYDAGYPTNDLIGVKEIVPRGKIVIFNGIVIFIYIRF